VHADQGAEMIVPRFGAHTRGQVPNLGSAILDPIALADLMGVIFISTKGWHRECSTIASWSEGWFRLSWTRM
jgi:hypothetical protein